MERLIVYETDKGNYAVRPEQWAGIIDKNGRIKECGLNHTAIFHYKKDAEWYADAKNAEEQGLLLRLPVAEGTDLYGISESYFFNDDDKPFYSVYKTIFKRTMIEDFGETIFLTKEEAEQALAKMKEV